VLAAVVIAGAAAACGTSAADAANGKIQLTMWQQWGGGHEQQMLQTVIDQYEKLHPNVTITQTPVTNNAKILAAITGGDPPDIVDLGNSLSLGSWAAAGAAVPLNEMLKRAQVNLSVYNARALDGMKIGNTIYALPFQSFDVALLYNKKLFAQAGLNPPRTLAELDADAAKLTKVNSAGQITQLGFVPDYPSSDQGQTCPLETYGWLFNGHWFDHHGKATPLDPGNVAALRWEQHFYTESGTQRVSNFVGSAGAYLTGADPFESGKLAMMLDGPWSEQYAEANNPALAKYVGVVPLPAPDPRNTGTTFLDSNPQFIPAGAGNVQAAFDFIAWETTNAKVTAGFSNDVANVPQLRQVPAFSLQKDPLFNLYVKEALSVQAHTWTLSAQSTTYGTDLCQAEQAALVGGQSARSALAAVVENLAQQ
jgi:ABC-type glycerol-3-phosphate transport system substrate-binding protein